MFPKQPYNKYHRKKVIFDGIEFDSELEGKRYLYLKQLEREGKIIDLRRQVRFELIPAQTITIERTGKNGKPIKPLVRTVEHNVEYTADFSYRIPEPHLNNEGWKFYRHIVEDTKGFKTKDYIIKRKLMRYQGWPVYEVTRPCQPIGDIPEGYYRHSYDCIIAK